MPKLAAYNASKHAIEGFTDALRLELVGTGVKTHSIAPGTVATLLYDQFEAESREYMFSAERCGPQISPTWASFFYRDPRAYSFHACSWFPQTSRPHRRPFQQENYYDIPSPISHPPSRRKRPSA